MQIDSNSLPHPSYPGHRPIRRPARARKIPTCRLLRYLQHDVSCTSPSTRKISIFTIHRKIQGPRPRRRFDPRTRNSNPQMTRLFAMCRAHRLQQGKSQCSQFIAKYRIRGPSSPPPCPKGRSVYSPVSGRAAAKSGVNQPGN